MAASTPVASSTSTTPSYVDQAQEAMRTSRKARNSLIWSAVNTACFAVILYDMTETCHARNRFLDYFEFVLLCIFLLNIIYNLVNYFTLFVTFKPVPLTQRQKQLLGVQPGNGMFPTLTPQAKSTPVAKVEPMTPLNLSAASWLNSSAISSVNNTVGSSQSLFMSSSPSVANASMQSTGGFSMSSPSWPGSPNMSMTTSWLYQPGTPPAPQSLSHLPEVDEPITDEASLANYLKKCEEYDKKLAAASPKLNSSPTNISTLWSSPLNSSGSPADLMVPSNSSYQLAPVTVPLDPSSQGTPGFDPGTSKIVSVNEEKWHKFGVNMDHLAHWNKNLRQWITATVLSRVCKEIENINSSLQKLGLSDERVGTSGLEQLKKTAQMAQVAQLVPSLTGLMPFLELTTHQDYLVQRIKELAQGGCMSNFRWSSGGQYNGKPWEDHLPTDSALVMHLFASYLDVLLPPLMHRPDWRPFTAQYLRKIDEKPVIKDDDNFEKIELIYQARVNPPHYVFYWKKKVLEVPQGCNNLLHTLLLFLHIRREQDGMLGRMNLGPSGLNILWVIGK